MNKEEFLDFVIASRNNAVAIRTADVQLAEQARPYDAKMADLILEHVAVLDKFIKYSNERLG